MRPKITRSGWSNGRPASASLSERPVAVRVELTWIVFAVAAS
jgi:hypothetical protein